MPSRSYLGLNLTTQLATMEITLAVCVFQSAHSQMIVVTLTAFFGRWGQYLYSPVVYQAKK